MTDNYRRALKAEPQLRAIDRLVDVLAALAPTRRSGRPLCSGCTWERIVKPLTSPWVGHERGFHPDVAEDPDPDRPPIQFLKASDLKMPPRVEATTEIERWLRTSEAWDAVTRVWIDRLHHADPANGHGLPTLKESAR